LKLSDLKGCVVVMRRDLEATFGIKMFNLKDDHHDDEITAGGAGIRVQDAYEYRQVMGSSIAEEKWRNVKALLDAAKRTPSTWFINFTSASHSAPVLNAYPWDIASGSWGVNARLARYLVTTPLKGRLGSVLMDYADEPADGMVCKLLIAQNERLCNSVEASRPRPTAALIPLRIPAICLPRQQQGRRTH
jgi:hypothetical protein